ncbi:MAG TPA: hypothetical protein VN809_04045, partial [Telmatospirillum sp.]|nr:hypothetical protein [Telmatospirillum sp.]
DSQGHRDLDAINRDTDILTDGYACETATGKNDHNHQPAEILAPTTVSRDQRRDVAIAPCELAVKTISFIKHDAPPEQKARLKMNWGGHSGPTWPMRLALVFNQRA